MTKQLKCYYLLLIRYYKLSLLNQFLEGYSIMAAWGNNFFKTIFFLLFFHFSAPLKCHWPIRASSLKSHSPAGRIYSPLATGRVLMKRLCIVININNGALQKCAELSPHFQFTKVFLRVIVSSKNVWLSGRNFTPPLRLIAVEILLRCPYKKSKNSPITQMHFFENLSF